MKIYMYILIMAVVTYLIRAVPLILMKKKIENRFIKSFLYYVPYTCLSAMTVPAIFFATSNVYTAIVGFVTALILAIRDKSLVVVAACACMAVFIAELICNFIM